MENGEIINYQRSFKKELAAVTHMGWLKLNLHSMEFEDGTKPKLVGEINMKTLENGDTAVCLQYRKV